MAIAGQTIATTAPSRASQSSLSANSSGLDSALNDNDKHLKNNEFSTVLNEQSKSEIGAKSRKLDGSNEESIQQDHAAETAVNGTSQVADAASEISHNGNVLPTVSTALPVSGEGGVNAGVLAGDGVSTSGKGSEEDVEFSLKEIVGSLKHGEGQPVVKDAERGSLQKPLDSGQNVAVTTDTPIIGTEKGGSAEALISNGSKVENGSVSTLGLATNSAQPDGKASTSIVEGPLSNGVPESSKVVPGPLGMASEGVGGGAENAPLVKSPNRADSGDVQASITGNKSNTVTLSPNVNASQPSMANTSAGLSPPTGGGSSEGVVASNSASISTTQNFTAQLAAQFQLKAQLGAAGGKLDEKTVDMASVAGLESGDTPRSSTHTFTALTDWSTAYKQPLNAVAQVGVPVEVGKAGWSDGVMAKVMWMSSQQISKAEIALDPPELGPLQVRISTQSDQTSVVFTSSHGVVRDALDQGLPRLREMMENQGLDLADVDVSDQRSFGRESHAEDDAIMSHGEDGVSDDSNEQSGVVADSLVNQVNLGLVDYYV